MSDLVRRKQVDVKRWVLDGKAAMIEVFSDLMDDGWRGGVNPVGDSYRLELHRDDQSIIATIGDVIVNDYTVRRCTPAECAADYDVVVP